MKMARGLVTIGLSMIGLVACDFYSNQQDSIDRSSQADMSEGQSSLGLSQGDLGKADLDQRSPALQDLAIVFPQDRATLLATHLIPVSWINAVEEALAHSELAEFISDETYIEDWRLVSLRVSPCSPLGRVAEREEIDRLCWPGVRLVFQPIVERLSVRGIIRDHYADDRAIHALYRLDFEDPSLGEVIAQIRSGARLGDLDSALLERFESKRDQLAEILIERVMSLRLTDEDYTLPRERPEFYELELEERFLDGLLNKVLAPFCQVESLHELTAFSLPLGRSPVSLDLWSFVAFSQENGVLKQEPIRVFSRVDGQELFSFSGENERLSEDVTVSQGDPQVEEAISELPLELGEQLKSQVILETELNDPKIDQINDPYQTLVNQTTCASCHRANNLNFDFHNLSYLEDYEVTISPRTLADVERDRVWSAELIRARSKRDPID